ncbi:MAG: YdcF family protein [Eubacteriales bacterium]|jgi:uncharacterized SAM-binding protein YcdF (DUF218 family)
MRQKLHPFLWGERVFCIVLGVVLLTLGFGSLPYGVFHIGNAALLAGGMGCLLWPWLAQWLDRHIRWLCWMIRMVLVGGIALCAALLFQMNQQASLEPLTQQQPVAIVLGCQVYPSGEPSMMLQGRLEAALSYLNENPEAVCIVSGGQGPDEPMAESECMAQWLEDRGIDPSRIRQENESHNTEENIHNSLDIARQEGWSTSMVIITDDYHQSRALELFDREGAPASGTVSSRAPLMLRAGYWAREMGGMVLMKLGLL